jgi:hypothetical protein
VDEAMRPASPLLADRHVAAIFRSAAGLRLLRATTARGAEGVLQSAAVAVTSGVSERSSVSNALTCSAPTGENRLKIRGNYNSV